MHVLVATDGELDPTTVAKFAAPIAGDDGTVTVLTVIEVPRAMLQELQTHFNDQQPPILRRTDSEHVVATPSIDPPRSWPGDDAIIQQYLVGKQEERCNPVIAALAESGVNTVSLLVEGPAAKGILEIAAGLDVDVIVVGSHGVGLFEGLLGSTGTKVMRMAKRPVLLLRTDTA